MQRALFVVMALMVALTTFAIDIIVKTDGSTIQAKVLKISPTEIEYKKVTNINGPSYTIPVAEVMAINYENGEKEVFEGNNPASTYTAPTPYSNNPDIMTRQTATTYSDDAELLRVYNTNLCGTYKKKAKILKLSGLIGGSVLFVGGMAMAISGDFMPDDSGMVIPGIIMSGVGLVGGTTCFLVGNNYQKKAKQLMYTANMIENEFQLGNGHSLNVGLGMTNLPYTPSKAMSMTFCYSF